ncbi:MAG: ribonuclease P protein component [Planctomycetes bacterium]|nr:ribonuclease P protein component [Planctomycetota bacterium]
MVTFYENVYNKAVAQSLTLSKRQRLVKNDEFRAVLDQRKRCSDHLLVVHMAANGLAYSRLGVSIGRVQGNAVVRNRIKRLIREAFRLTQCELPTGYDVLVTMPKRRQGRSRPAGVADASIKGDHYSLSAMHASLVKLVNLCHKKTLNS